MNTVAAIVTWSGAAEDARTLESLRDWKRIEAIGLAVKPGVSGPKEIQTTVDVPTLWTTSSVLDILKWFDRNGADHLLWVLPGSPVLPPLGLDRLWCAANDSDAAITYGDYFELHADDSTSYHPLIDYQTGSLRDDFDFGAAVLLSRKHLKGLVKEIDEANPDLEYGGWYDLRLRLAERGPRLHLSEPVYLMPPIDQRASGQKVFDYVDPGRREFQVEMEKVATEHLRRIGALLEPPPEVPLEEDGPYSVEASVVIPVKNRSRTIADAVRSALSQATSFDFNVIVVNNHSTDETTQILGAIASEDARLVHLVPKRRDLLIGGCWNEAIYSPHCGRVAVQLDSDDLYDGTDVLERIVHTFQDRSAALVIGSYTTVDFDLRTHPPGLVDHREWTDGNGHNNALRIAGLGAPRAYHTATLRKVGFPNVSYGEDYAVVLRLSRTHRVGRIYDTMYWCRRWEENSDSALSLETANRYASYKDRLRTIEIAARQKLVKDAR